MTISSISSLIDSVHRLEQRNHFVGRAIICMSFISATLLFLVVFGWYPRWAAALAVLSPIAIVLWVIHPGVRSLSVSRSETALHIDRALSTKERVVSLTSLLERSPDRSTAEQELITSQLLALIPQDTKPQSIAPFSLTVSEKRSIAASLVLLLGAVALFLYHPVSPLEALARTIEELQESQANLAPEVQQAASALLEQLHDPAATNDEIQRAITSTKDALASSTASKHSSSKPKSATGSVTTAHTGRNSREPDQKKQEPTPSPSQSKQPKDRQEKESAPADKQEASEQAPSANSSQQSNPDAKQGQEQGAQEKTQGSQQKLNNSQQSKDEGAQESKGSDSSNKESDKTESQQDASGGQQSQQGEQSPNQQSQEGQDQSNAQPNSQGGGSSGAGSQGQGSSGDSEQESQQQENDSNASGTGKGKGTGAEKSSGQGDDNKSDSSSQRQGAAQGGSKEGTQKLQDALDKAESALKENSQAGNTGSSQNQSSQKEGSQKERSQSSDPKESNSKSSASAGQDNESKGGGEKKSGSQSEGTAGTPANPESKKNEDKNTGKGPSQSDGVSQENKESSSKNGSSKSETKGDKADKPATQSTQAASPKLPGTDQSGKNDEPSKEKGSEAKKEDQDQRAPGSRDDVGAESAQVDRNAKARSATAGDEGPPGPGLGGKEEFKEVQIDSSKEKLDDRYTGEESSIEEGTPNTQPKTSLADVTLAKPKPSSQKAEQPIPLEYRDILK